MSELKVNKITPRTGTTITLGDSGDTFTIPSGATQSITGTLSGAGAIDLSSATITLNDVMKNTPAFQATISSSFIDLTNDTLTKVAFDTESFDTDGCYDNATNYRFTPTVAGKYFVYLELQGGNSTTADSDIIKMISFIYKNGVNEFDSRMDRGNSTSVEFFRFPVSVSAVIDMNGSTDYVEGYVQMAQGGTRTMRVYGGTNSRFGAYKLIGI